MYKTQLKIFDAINKLEAKNKRLYSDNEIAKATGLHRHTINVMRKGKAEPTLDKLLDFFASEGMPIEPNDLFDVVIDVSDTITTGEQVKVEVQPPDKP